jgi:RNA polymerase sigma factor (sigma-70 family)
MQSNDSPNDPADAAPTFERCYADVAPALFAWAELRIRPQLRVRLDPQDLVQEVWLRGLRNFARFDPAETTFRAWIFRIGKNVILEALRTLSTEGSSPASKVQALDGLPHSVTSFTQRIARDETVRAFLEHAGRLDEDERTVLVLCGLEAKSCAEVAAKIGQSEEAVAKRWQRLRARLRDTPHGRGLLADGA